MSDASITTIILFFVYTWGLGYGATYFLKEQKNIIERQIIRIGIGLAILPILLMILNFLHIPLNWVIILLLSISFPFYNLINLTVKQKGIKLDFLKEELKLSKSNIAILIVLLFFGITAYMYISGAFAYPWLEDDDPWSHTAGIMYVKYAMTASDPQPDFAFPYMGPNYPPGYDAMMGVIHQTSLHRMWTVKFFNALIISLGILFFYFMARRIFKNTWQSVFATFVLAAIPCYLSHFIWAHVMFPTMLFILIYCIDMSLEDKKYSFVSTFIFASMLVLQPEHGIKGAIISVIYILVRSYKNWKFLLNIVYIHILGGIVSLIWWGKYAKIMWEVRSAKISAETAGAVSTGASSIFEKVGGFLQTMFPPDSGTASRVYEFGDFFNFSTANQINGPVGVGKVLWMLLFVALVLILFYLWQKSLLLFAESKSEKNIVGMTLACLVFCINAVASITVLMLIGRYLSLIVGSGMLLSLKLDLILMITLTFSYLVLFLSSAIEDNKWPVLVLLSWLLFAFLGINSMTFNLPIGLMAFRFWILLAIPASLLIAEGVWIIFSMAKETSNIIKIGIVAILAVGILITSGVPKYEYNTMIWPPGASFGTSGQYMDYYWLKQNLEPETKVFTLDQGNQYRLVSYDMYSCEWCREIRDFRSDVANRTVDEIYTFMKSHEYEYAIIGHQYVLKNSVDSFKNMATSLQTDPRFEVVLATAQKQPPYENNAPTIIYRIR